MGIVLGQSFGSLFYHLTQLSLLRSKLREKDCKEEKNHGVLKSMQYRSLSRWSP